MPVRPFTFFAVVLAISACLHAERLPIKSFSSDDGLAHDHINQIYRDSHGLLWICTDEGLSRFDGYEFTNFMVADGLPHPHANGILEIPDKGYWIATDGGLVWFDTQRFTVYRPPGGAESSKVNSLARDGKGILWLGTNNGLFRMAGETIETVDRGKLVTAVQFDGSGSLWVSTSNGVYRRDKNGGSETFLQGYINATFHDSRGRHWFLTRTAGLAMLNGRSFSVKDGLPSNDIRSMYEIGAGKYWLATVGGLVEMTDSGASLSFRVYTTGNGLSDNRIYKLETDGGGNLWIGTNHAGIQRIERGGFVSYGSGDGLQLSEFQSFSETRDGTLVLVSGDNEKRTLHWFDGRRFHSLSLKLPQGARGFGWGWNQHAFEDTAGRWWLPVLNGVYRYPRAKSLPDLAWLQPKAIEPMRQIGCAVSRLYEDSRKDVWIATTSDRSCKQPDQLFVWKRRTGETIHFDPGQAAWPKGWAPTSFREDKSGNLWVGLAGHAGVLRIGGDSVERFAVSEGLDADGITALLCDHQGRLWIGTNDGGLARVDEPQVRKPTFQMYTTASGLSSNQIFSLVEDNAGYIYAATGRGLDRIDPARSIGSGAFRRFTPSDGFLKGEIRSAYRDRNGTIWFASIQGAAALAEVHPVEHVPTAVRISGLRVNGVTQTPSSNLDLGPDVRQVEIEFSGIDYTTNRQLLYQYKLKGADADWSAPTAERRVNYANLKPGNYRFMVRTSDSKPESLSFSIEAPLSQRWWFRLLSVILLASAAYAAHRIRLSRVLALERLRAQIATDLHDDIGSSLSQIAVLTEVARLRANAPDDLIAQPLSRIGEIARELADSMSDIVWAINPRHDHLADLVYRMRRFVDETLSAGNIHLDIAVAGAGTLVLDASQRRDVFLIFKEVIHNAVRHSGCDVVTVEVDFNHKRLSLRVSDNGKGFAVDKSEHSRGSGLESIRRRAKRLNGQLEIISKDGQGTSIHLVVSLGKRDYMSV
jgi:signal transduction histidine kinase/ligand-binding sensor domain-containing protein